MRIAVILDPNDISPANLALVHGLRAAGHEVGVIRGTRRQSVPAALAALLLLDRTLHGRPSGGAGPDHGIVFDWQEASGTFDLAILLSCPAEAVTALRTLTPAFDGSTDALALWSALLDRHAPLLSLLDSGSDQHCAIGAPALERPHCLEVSASSVNARVTEGILATVRDIAAGRALICATTAPRTMPLHASRFAAKLLAGKARRVQDKILKTGAQWAVAWREATGDVLPPRAPIDLSGWRVLPDDGQRYFADPFVIEHGGKRHLFVEEFPYASARGIISHCVIDAAGRASAPRPVLESGWHLSYPQVFRHSGAIYMLPEASASGGLDLYRAEEFPNRWVPVARLLDTRVHDATLVEHGGHFWLFAATECGDSSSWDALSLYYSKDLFGPWMPHPRNPVLLDAASARPGGAMVRIGGDLWRPAQDCRGGYGAALTLAKVTTLDVSDYRQEIVHTIRCAAGSDTAKGVRPLRRGLTRCGPHTWNSGAGLDVIDVFGRRQRGQTPT